MRTKDLRICLIRPGIHSYIRTVGKSFRPEPLAPLSLLYLGSILRREGYSNIKVINCIANEKTYTTRDGEFVRTTIPAQEIAREITEFKPHVIGITCMYSGNFTEAVNVARIAKKVCPDVPIVLGGVHVTGQPKETLQEFDCFDIAVIGEGENTIVEVMEYIENQRNLKDINGICFRQNEEIITTLPRAFISDLDDIPFPAYDLVDLKKFPNVYMITSRGCPYRCIFCGVPLYSGRKWRSHSVDYIIDHIKLLVYKYNIRRIPFLDDHFALNLKRVSVLVDRILVENLDFKWDVVMRTEKISKELLVKMKKAGCQSISIGAESGDQQFLNEIIRKDLNLEDVIRLVELCEDVGMPIWVYFVIGIPGEKKETLRKTRKLQHFLWRKRYVGGITATIATPYAGTELYEICKEKGYFTHEPTPEALAKTVYPFGDSLIRTEDFSPKDLIRFTVGSYIMQLSNPGKLLRKSLKDHGAVISRLAFIKASLG